MSRKKSKNAFRNGYETRQRTKNTFTGILLATGIVIAAWIGYSSLAASEKKSPEEVRQAWAEYLNQGDNCIQGDFPISSDGIPTGEVLTGCISSGSSYFINPWINITHLQDVDSGGNVPMDFTGTRDENGDIDFVAGCAFGEIQINSNPGNPIPLELQDEFMRKEVYAPVGCNYVLTHVSNPPELVEGGRLNALADAETLIIARALEIKQNFSIQGGAIEAVSPSEGPSFTMEECNALENVFSLEGGVTLPYSGASLPCE